MKINNEKGHIHHVFMHIILGSSAASSAIPGIFGAILIAAITIPALWHINEWSHVKANHNELKYQTMEMWPQQVFDKFPGGGSHTVMITSGGNSGNFSGGNSGPIAE